MKTVRVEKDEARWRPGTVVGIIDFSNEYLIGTSKRTVKCRAIHPRDPEKKWDIEAMKNIKGTPWKPHPNRKSFRVPTHIDNADGDDDNDDEDPDGYAEQCYVHIEIRLDTREDADVQRKAIKVEKQRERKKVMSKS